MATKDLPATIDAILNVTGAPALYYVGHSQVSQLTRVMYRDLMSQSTGIDDELAQGALIGFGLLADRPLYNEKVTVTQHSFGSVPAHI